MSVNDQLRRIAALNPAGNLSDLLREQAAALGRMERERDELRARFAAMEEAHEALRQAACAALGRLREVSDAATTDAALGFGPETTDAGQAFAALRRAAGVRATRDEVGVVTFHRVSSTVPPNAAADATGAGGGTADA